MRVIIEQSDGSFSVRIPAELAAELDCPGEAFADLRIENRKLVMVPSAVEPRDAKAGDAFGKARSRLRGTIDPQD